MYKILKKLFMVKSLNKFIMYKESRNSSIYLLFYPSDRQSVRLHPINVKTAEPIGPKFCVRPHMTPARVYLRLKITNLCPKVFEFCKILKMRDLLFFFFFIVQMLADRATIKSLKIKYVRESALKAQSCLSCHLCTVYCIWIGFK